MNSTKKQPTTTPEENRRTLVAEKEFPLWEGSFLRLRLTEVTRPDSSTYLSFSASVVLRSVYFGRPMEETYWLNDMSPNLRGIFLDILRRSTEEEGKK